MDQNTPSDLDSLSAEIDNAVEDLFGGYTTPQEPATPQQAAQPTPAAAAEPIQTPQPAVQPVTPAEPQPEKSSLDAEIDKAVDDLFGDYTTPQAAPATPQAPPPQQEAPAIEPTLEMEEIPAPPVIEEPAPVQPTPVAAAESIQTPQPAVQPVTPAEPQPEKSALDAEIDKAVDDLFGAYDTPQEAATAVPQPPPPQQEAPAVEPSLEIEEIQAPPTIEEPIAAQEAPFPADMPTGSLWELLDQAFLTIDWDVSSANVRAAKRIFDNLRSELNIDKNKELGPVALLMDQILVAMARSPENVPTIGPQALKDGLNALKAAHENLDTTAQDLLNNATAVLQSALPEMPAEGQIAAAPAGAAGLLQKHAAFLAKCIKNISSFEKLFSQKPAYKKLHNAEIKIRTNLENQAEKISSLTQELISSGSTDLTAEAANTIESHIAVLQQCSKNILSIENLFANKAALKKVYNIHQKMRLSLEKQIQSLNNRIPAGGMPSIADIGTSVEEIIETPQEIVIPIEVVDDQPVEDEIQPISSFMGADEIAESPEVEISTIDSAHEAASAHPKKVPCPWENLITAEWQGKAVAFIPSEVAYEERANSWIKKRQERLTVLPVRRLKKHIWSNLGRLFRGEMKFLGETYLKHMNVPMLNHVGAYRDSTKAPKKPILLVLFNEGYGGSVILKAPTKSFPVSKSWNWQPIKQKGSILAGYLNAKGKSLPVITVSRLE